LEESWALSPAALEYQPVGYGSYHWLAQSTDGSRWFVTADAAAGPFAVRPAYAVARRLAECGLDFVRAPRPTAEGRVVLELGDWLLSLWPWIDGRSATTGQHASTADLVATLRCVRRLHEFDGIEPVAELVEDWELSGRAALVDLLAGDAWGVCAYAADARDLVLGAKGRIDRALARYDELVTAVRAGGVDFVATHGEPHAANVVHTADGPVLIDWDTLRWAPKERDLWSLVGMEGWREGYGDGPVSPDAVAVYRLQWELSEIADFAQLLAEANNRTPDADVAMRELRGYLR
jgi:spectinomycin phosphotransferase